MEENFVEMEIDVSEEELKLWKKKADELGISVNDMIIQALDEHLMKEN